MKYAILNGVKRVYTKRTKRELKDVIHNYPNMKYIGTTNEFEENERTIVYDEPYHLFVENYKSTNNFY